MATATLENIYTSRTAADRLGLSDARIRQICIDNRTIGKKHGHVWLLTEADILRIENLPDLRKRQPNGD